jgi:hypothetical protein
MGPNNTARARKSSFFSIVTLARWQVRQTWRLLVICGVGMFAAVILVCTMPLYSRMALSSGLHAALNAAPENSTLGVISTLNSVRRPASVDALNQAVTSLIQNDLPAHALSSNSQFTLSIGGVPILSPTHTAQYLTQFTPTGAGASELNSLAHIQMLGMEREQLTTHIHLLQGRLPLPLSSSDTLEIDLQPAVARCLFLYLPSPAATTEKCYSASVGDAITIVSPLVYQSASGDRLAYSAMTLRVVGLYTPLNENDAFWQGNSLGTTSNGIYDLITGLTTSEALASTLNNALQGGEHSAYLVNDARITWIFHLDVEHIDATNINALTTGLDTLLSDVSSGIGMAGVQSTASAPTDLLNEFNSRLVLSQLPVNLLLLLVGSMVILFLGLTTELLIERQTEAIALLCSRGASRLQIFGVFATQMLAPALFALIAGPLLAIPLAVTLAYRLFSSVDTGAVALLSTQPLDAAWNVRWYALLAVGFSLLFTLLTLYQTTRLDVLALRREQGRPTHKPFWQRFYLDGLLAVLALGSYGYALYASKTGVLDPATSTQVLTPLIVLTAALVLLAGLLLFLRYFPRLVQLAGDLTARRSGAASLLALSQIARTPRQAMRMILLLTLTTAFALFSLVFSASQSQRIADVVNYQVGADFSVQLPSTTLDGQPANSFSSTTLTRETALYRAIPGVLSTSLGILAPAQFGNTSLSIKAVDTTTFARTAIWTSQDSTQPLSTLLAELSTRRMFAQQEQVVPAIVDAETWSALHLSVGQRFTLSLSTIGNNGTQIPFLALAEVQHIPTMLSFEGSALSAQGILVDAQSFSSVFTRTTNQPPSLNAVWLRTRADAQALASVRAALVQRVTNTASSGNAVISDRRALLITLQHDPLALNLTGVLTIGTLTPLLLALLGSLLFSWLNARNRLLSFAVLRALGSSPAQLAGVLFWEQSITYSLVVGLGLFCGLLLAALALPSLILSSVAMPGSAVSSLPPAQGDLPALQIVLPPLLLLVLGLLTGIGLLTLILMARMVSRPSLSQTLRLNAD